MLDRCSSVLALHEFTVVRAWAQRRNMMNSNPMRQAIYDIICGPYDRGMTTIFPYDTMMVMASC